MKHLTYEEIILYVNKEIAESHREQVKEHFQSCSACRKAAKQAEDLSDLITLASASRIINHANENCYTQNVIKSLLSGKISNNKRQKIIEHFCKCRNCVQVLIKTWDSIRKNYAATSRFSLEERTLHTVMNKVREKRKQTLLTKVDYFISSLPVQMQKTFTRKFNRIKKRISVAFSDPTPAFPPVFGKELVCVISPFGKVEYPIIFEWRSYGEKCIYEVLIKDINWSVITVETTLQFNKGKLALVYGEEYMWELRVKKDNEIIDEVNGFITLATLEEMKIINKFEKHIAGVEPVEDRLVFWGEFFEEMEFYMDAIKKYRDSFNILQSSALAYKIAYCYDKLELENLREEWNKIIY